MANTYTQILIQYVFSVKHRDACIDENFREPLEKYITGIVSNSGHKLLAIYCMPNHCHILIGLHPTQSISDLARDIKSNSSKWINEEKHLRAKFNWQDGYGAFSYSRSQLDSAVEYILNQPKHHHKRTFREEYIDFLQKFEVDYDSNYLFDWID